MRKSDIVAIGCAMPKLGLRVGDVGTVIDVFPVGYEVEFIDAKGRTKAVATFDPRDLRPADLSDMVRIHQAEVASQKVRVTKVSSEFLFVAYLFAVVFPILGFAFSIYLAWRRERGHSYGVFMVSLAMLALLRTFFWR